jgi:hypothetical protein
MNLRRTYLYQGMPDTPAVHPMVHPVKTMMMEESRGMHGMTGEHGMKPALLWLMWEKMDPSSKKTIIMRMLDEKIMKKEARIKYLQHKVETYKMVKQMMDKVM